MGSPPKFRVSATERLGEQRIETTAYGTIFGMAGFHVDTYVVCKNRRKAWHESSRFSQRGKHTRSYVSNSPSSEAFGEANLVIYLSIKLDQYWWRYSMSNYIRVV